MKKRIFKILLAIVFFVLALIVTAVVTTQTRFFKNWLRDELVDVANKNLVASISLGKIDGNLITSFALDRLLIQQEGDTLLYLPSLNFRIVPKSLLQKQMRIQVLDVDSLCVILRQRADSTWNFQHIIREDTLVATADTAAQPINWSFILNDMQVRDASIIFSPLNKISAIPERISSLDLQLDAQYKGEMLNLAMRNLKLRTQEPKFLLQKIAFSLAYDENKLTIDNLEIETENSRLRGKFTYANTNINEIDFFVDADKLDFTDIKVFLPEFPVAGRSQTKLTGHLAGDSLFADLTMRVQQQRLHLQAMIPDIIGFNNYKCTVEIANLNTGYWLQNDTLKANINGKLKLTGSGLSPDTAFAHVDAAFYNMAILDRRLDSLYTKINYTAGDVNGDLKMKAPTGNFTLSTELNDIFYRQKFDANLTAQHIDLDPLLLSDSLHSDINFKIRLRGRHFDPDSMTCEFHFEGGKSSLLGAQIDTLFSWGSWVTDAGKIDTLRLESPLGQFFLAGDLGLSSDNQIRFHGDLGDLQWVEKKIEADTLKAAGAFSGQIQGKLQALVLKGNYDFNNIQYDEIAIGNARGDFNSNLTNEQISARGQLFVHSLNYAQTGMDTVTIFWGFKDSVFVSNVYLSRQDSIQSQARFSYHLKEIPEIHIADFSTRVKNLYWQNSSRDARILIGPDYYDIHGVHLKSVNQNLYIDGTWSDSSESNLQIRIDSLQIKPIAQLMQIEEELNGTIDTHLRINGNSQKPVINGNLAIKNGTVMEFRFERLQGDFSLMDEKLSWDFILSQDSSRGMQFDGFLPVNPTPGDSGNFILQNEPIRLHAINTRKGGLDLSFLQAFLPDMRNVKGRFLANVKVTNTLENPLPAGSIRVFDGQFGIPRYGVRYKNLQVSVQFDSTDIRIQQFDLQGGNGLLSASGKLAFNDGLQAGMRSAELAVTAENFQVAKNRDIFLIIDAKGRLFGEVAQPRFDGVVKLRRSTFNLTALENSRYVELEQVQPLLEQARLDTSIELKPQNTVKKTESEQTTCEVSDYYKNLKGDLRIEIGRNSWLRSPTLNVEINGELLQSKQSAEFEMPVGAVQVVRGNYDFLGKSFKIEKGEFTLDGGDEVNPLVDLEAVYSIRDADRNKIRIVITGRALDPEIKFYLNTEEIEETNAVSYIVFGRNLEQVSSGERQDLQKGQLLTQLAAAQLTKTLGKKLSLDVIEFQGRSESDAASSITVGRYISDNIFISIQQLIGGDNWETMESLRATLELELRDNIFMQFTKGDEKTTGFDLIWKYQK
ncbi:MAG: translocation/assembly module TamB domain-containing protein [Deferribacteres bacterium]|nr:translocation/assembly module TamB domain-containing protein [candidate division KSB1 bacterium]MCB9502849.1 translocation/assembly module TamB domain-containing protein [Deferribacteres bacterium]